MQSPQTPSNHTMATYLFLPKWDRRDLWQYYPSNCCCISAGTSSKVTTSKVCEYQIILYGIQTNIEWSWNVFTIKRIQNVKHEFFRPQYYHKGVVLLGKTLQCGGKQNTGREETCAALNSRHLGCTPLKMGMTANEVWVSPFKKGTNIHVLLSSPLIKGIQKYFSLHPH